MAHPAAIFIRLERLRQFLANFLREKWSLRRSNEHLVKPLHIRSLAKIIQLQSTSRSREHSFGTKPSAAATTNGALFECLFFFFANLR
uniref:Uncharacterized protein n=1 Tax=Acrobeloides nanus TaxID=290746 RepID=A0A914C0H8_9BILA